MDVEVAFSSTPKAYTNEAYESDNLQENKKDMSDNKSDNASHVPNNGEITKEVDLNTVDPSEIALEGGTNIEGGNITRDRPFSASMISRASVSSTRSHASLSPNARTSEYGSAKMFSYKEGKFKDAVEKCKQTLLDDNAKEDVKGSWLLTEIDYWDFELEKLLILTTTHIYIVKFDFIKMQIRETRKISLSEIRQVQISDLKYPNISIMPARDQGGIRLHLGSSSFFQRWNPFCRSLPLITFTHHALIYNKNETETVTYNADDFAESIVVELTKISEKTGIEVEMKDDPILIDSYASLTSVVYNQSKLGFNLDRGGINY